MTLMILQIALGGAIGAVARFMTGVWIFRLWGSGFPLPTLAVNVLGSFLMGVFVVVAAQKGLVRLSPFVMTGLMGGFTTFSAFSLDTVVLIERGQIGQASLYVGLSVVLSIGALMFGLWLTRGAFA